MLQSFGAAIHLGCDLTGGGVQGWAVQERDARQSFQAPYECARRGLLKRIFLKRFYRVAITSRLVVYLGEIQIELRMIALYLQCYATQPLTSDITFLGHSTEHARIGEKERVLRLRPKSAANMTQGYAFVSIAKVP